MNMKLNKMIDHTKLGPNVSDKDIDKIILEAKEYDFKSICVNPIFVKKAKEALKDTDVLVCTVIGFPSGAHLPEVKLMEARLAILDGADELDMVININALKEKRYNIVLDEIEGVVRMAEGRTVKVIIETCFLTKEEIVKASKLVVEAGADFVKTSTGFGAGGAELEDVKIMKETVKDNALVKASGGVRTYEDAIKMIEAGASRIGTSNGVNIMKKEGSNNDSNTTY